VGVLGPSSERHRSLRIDGGASQANEGRADGGAHESVTVRGPEWQIQHPNNCIVQLEAARGKGEIGFAVIEATKASNNQNVVVASCRRVVVSAEGVP
jgi:hypothetical protein